VAEQADPLAGVQALLQGADLALGNLECVISARGEAAQKTYTFRAAPAAAQSLAQAGLDVLSLANNHSLDYGPLALADTLALLRQAGVQPVGAGRELVEAQAPALVEVNGLRLAVLAFNAVAPPGGRETWEAGAGQAGVAWAEAPTIRQAVAAAHQQAELVIVILHSGLEYSPGPMPEQLALGEAALQAGADLVVSAHPHTVQALQMQGRQVFAWSLGNFVFDGFADRRGAALRAWLDAEGVREIEIIPLDLASGLPAPAGPALADEILDLFRSLSRVSP
jgi:poly-gamma-glutamate synthesis protein (capsule biosynthesis protein)